MNQYPLALCVCVQAEHSSAEYPLYTTGSHNSIRPRLTIFITLRRNSPLLDVDRFRVSMAPSRRLSSAVAVMTSPSRASNSVLVAKQFALSSYELVCDCVLLLGTIRSTEKRLALGKPIDSILTSGEELSAILLLLTDASDAVRPSELYDWRFDASAGLTVLSMCSKSFVQTGPYNDCNVLMSLTHNRSRSVYRTDLRDLDPGSSALKLSSKSNTRSSTLATVLVSPSL